MSMPGRAFTSWNDLPFAWGGPILKAGFKLQPEDFQVEEELGFAPDGNGEHLFLDVEKSGLSTFEAQDILARRFNVARKDVAFAGMKDKHAVTRQWFSVQTRGSAIEQGAATLEHPQLRIVSAARNSRKLRRGSHKANRFRIVLRNPVGSLELCGARLQTLGDAGVPNYFGGQRFGQGEHNTARALGWFRGELRPDRQERGMILSAARSYLFNALLAERVTAGTWNNWIDGDMMALAGTASTFAATRATPGELRTRLQEQDIHASGPLWGSGQPPVSGAALVLEQTVVAWYPELAAGLAAQGLAQERRPLRLQVGNLRSSFGAGELVLEFSLSRGAYATAVLREFVTMGEA